MQFMKQLLILIVALFLSVHGDAQSANQTEKMPINQNDDKGQRQGSWYISVPERMDEQGYSLFGNYTHGKKNGSWYKIDASGELMAIENYRNDVLDGEVKYFERGALYCIGHYRGLNPLKKLDTFVVMDPVTHEERYVTIATEKGSTAHGTWYYYNPLNGHLLREEEYQVGELVYKKEYEVSAEEDKANKKKHEQAMPHVKGAKYKPPTSKQQSYLDY